MPLKEIRKAIEENDDKIIDCIAKRMEQSEKVFEIKNKENLAIEDEGRNKIILNRATEKANEYGLDAEGVKEIFEILIRMSIKRQKELKQKN